MFLFDELLVYSQSLLNLQIYENLTFLLADVDGREVLIRMKTEIEDFFSSKTSSLKVRRIFTEN